MAEITARKCSEIPDEPILSFVSGLNGRWGTWLHWQEDGMPVVPENCVVQAMPDGPDTPDRLVLAKMRRLIERGLIDGCPCGCRGDYEITEKGRAYLEAMSPNPHAARIGE